MRERFVPLDVFLQRALEPSAPPPQSAPPSNAPAANVDDETIRAARRFRAALADALDASVQRLLPAIACEVLGRELLLRGADVAAIVSSAIDRFGGERVVSLRVHPADVPSVLALDIPSIGDRTLQLGDAVVQLQSGTIDLRWAARLDAVLAACLP